MRTFWSFFVKVGALIASALVVYVTVIAIIVWHASTIDDTDPGAEAIVVLGAAQYNGTPSPVLRARLDHAADLWREKYAPTIVVTGGRIPGDSHTEAGASAAYLGTKGVPDANVLREVQGRSSWESLQATARFLEDRNIHDVILVSDPFHNARIKAMGEDLGLKVQVSATRTSPIKGRERVPYYLKEVASLSLGKLFGFARAAHLEKSFSAV